MSEELEQEENNQENQDFATLLESYNNGMNSDIRIGDRIKGEIISIGKDAVFISTGTKMDGMVEKAELLDEKGELPFKLGDSVELFVVSFAGNEVHLSKALSGIGGTHMLKEAFEQGIPVQGKVKGQIKGGFQVEVLQRRAFCPISHMELRYIETPNIYIGETYSFLITQFEENGRNIVLSRREILAKEQEKVKKEFFEQIKIGDEIEGRVTRLMPYGAFVELIPGVEGMAHISELSWSRTQKAEDVLRINDRIKAKIIGMEKKENQKDVKISLSIRQITGDPWETIRDQFKEGDHINGKVTRCMKFGAFVEIAPGVEGLVHISEMSYHKRVMKPEEIVKEGEEVQVVIKEIDSQNRRISLSIKEADGDPWANIQEKYSAGQRLNGTFEKKEAFGYFINLEPGITGLIPKSKVKESGQSNILEKAKQGDSIPIIIERINPLERKVSLEINQGTEEDEHDWHSYVGTAKKSKSFGSLGDKLNRALSGKE